MEFLINNSTGNIIVGSGLYNAGLGANNNIGIGTNMLGDFTNGQLNIAIGQNSNSGLNVIDTCNSVITIGANTFVDDITHDNCIVIGNFASPHPSFVTPHLSIGSVDVPLSQSTTASAGTASVLPALPSGYIDMSYNGSEIKIPYYNT